ncbi:hypothetical protein EVAR_73898_1 [Eumeta japonica]|uniref:Uncharacterized protein n=1 Tax=Eumeta variegata TaxID=151549 RepID=A0A4C1TM23_EUMVA|nr:hypothetical protein EVAR_73898_1 [Eumeta japonica]
MFQRRTLPDPSKVECIRQLKPTRTIKEVQALSGLINYYRKFVEGMAKLVDILYSTIEKGMLYSMAAIHSGHMFQEALHRFMDHQALRGIKPKRLNLKTGMI